MNRWEIYEMLKGNPNYDYETLKESSKDEIVEGIEEYVLQVRRNKRWI